MKLALLCFAILLGGWIVAREVYPASPLIDDLKVLPFAMLAVLIISRISDALWWERPIKRAAFGAGILLLAALTTVTLLALFPRPGTIMLGDPFDELLRLAVFSVLAGGLILSLQLIASSCLQGFKRWRYYRRNGS